MDWNAPVDIYCERLGIAFWAEPLNAVSNGAFILAALFGLYFAIRRNSLTPPNVLLICLAASIGIGSFLFHTLANAWSMLADQIPIGLFVLCYIALALRKFLNMSWPKTLSVMAIYFIVSAIIIYVLGSGILIDLSWTKGSHLYAPVVLGFIALGWALGKTKHPVTPYIWWAGVVFITALIFRSVDATTCSAVPMGTHFLWHSLNGLLIGIVLVAMMLHENKKANNA